MCKIMVMSGIKPGKSKKAWEFAKRMGAEMSSGNQDGIGYAAISDTGEIFGEKWHRNNDAFVLNQPYPEKDQEIMTEFQNFLWKEPKYEQFGGELAENITSIMLHTRVATSGKEFMNTHPFFKDGSALIHNGVIRNIDKDKDFEVSTCDSERILTRFIHHDVVSNPENIKLASQDLEGYYACGVLSNLDDGSPIVDVFKSQSASLGAVYVKELDLVIITTDPGNALTVAKDMKLSVESVYSIRSNMMIRFNGITGKVMGTYKFEERKYQSYNYGGRGTRYEGYSAHEGWADGYGGTTHHNRTHKPVGGNVVDISKNLIKPPMTIEDTAKAVSSVLAATKGSEVEEETSAWEQTLDKVWNRK